MTAVADAKRTYFKQAVGTTSLTAVADLEALYYEKAFAGTAVVVPEATATQEGTVKQMTFTADQSPDFATLAAVTTAYNALLAKLRASGQMAAS